MTSTDQEQRLKPLDERQVEAIESLAQTAIEIRDTIKFMSVGDEHNPGPVERISVVLEAILEKIS